MRITILTLFLPPHNRYEGVARPLEPYVLVFLAFGVPAAIMSTDYCRSHSNAQDVATASLTASNREITYGTCDVLCEFALAFRSMASVLV